VDEYKKSDAIFNSEYVYFSSFSTSWLEHSRKYTEQMRNALALTINPWSWKWRPMTAICCNISTRSNISVLGIEPTANTAEVAIRKRHRHGVDFFGVRLATRLAAENKKADLLLAIMCWPMYPDIVGFCKVDENPPEKKGGHHDGISPPDATGGQQPVRYDLS
jgi:hypothetical protein